MTYAAIDCIAWAAVRSLHERFIGRSREPTDEDWQEVIADAIEEAIGAEFVED